VIGKNVGDNCNQNDRDKKLLFPSNFQAVFHQGSPAVACSF